ncbi:MAG: PhzF family phenazine biosynthesis protein [Myxococcota bacterium]
MRRRFHTVDVFTDRAFGGNPLAVFPDGSGLATKTMQTIARELNLSETTFVLPPETSEGTRRVRIFTPTAELPFAGHPTLGTAHVLAALGEVALEGPTTRIVLELGVGPVPVGIESEAGGPTRCELTAATPPEVGPEAPAPTALAACLGLDPEDLAGVATAASCGVPYLFVPVRSREALARARIEAAAWERHLADGWAPSPFVFTRETGEAGLDLQARMFAPGLGVPEDPATGSAVAALAAVVADMRPGAPATQRFTVAQGVEMGRPSRLELTVEVTAGEIAAVRVAGRSVRMIDGELLVP